MNQMSISNGQFIHVNRTFCNYTFFTIWSELRVVDGYQSVFMSCLTLIIFEYLDETRQGKKQGVKRGNIIFSVK